jgi:hypothetical protein
MPWRQRLLIAFLLWASVAGAWPGCLRIFSRSGRIWRLEKKLARTIPGEDHVFGMPGSLSLEALRKHWADMRGGLIAEGVTFLNPSPTAIRRKHQTDADYDSAEGILEAPFLGPEWLFEIQTVKASASPEDARPTASVFRHPGTDALLEKMKKLGVTVYADPTTAPAGYGGSFRDDSNSITLPLGAGYVDFVHEAAHAEFYHYRISEFIARVAKKELSAKQLKELLNDPKFKGYGRDRLLRVVDLVKQGQPETAIDERMSVEAEHAELRRAGYAVTEPSFKKNEDYARWHLLNELAQVAAARPLTPVERRTFLKAIFAEVLAESSDSGQRQVRYGAKLVKMLGDEGPEPMPDFADARFTAHWKKENRRKLVNGLAGTAALGLTIAFNKELGRFLVTLSNGTVIEGLLDDDEKKKKNKSGGE